METLSGIGRWLLTVGGLLALVGAVLTLIAKAPGAGEWLGWLGRLPGDFSYKRDHVSVYVPLATSLVISVILSLLFSLFSWLGKR